jgi:hypothetical protein
MSHLQRFLQLITGVFYGAACSRPYLVPVPVRDGIDRPPTLDDLEYTASRRILRRTFDTVPCSTVPIGGWYAVFFEIPSPSSPPNQLLARMSKMSGSHETVLGSILVIKQRADHAIVDMTKGDQTISNFLVSRYNLSLFVFINTYADSSVLHFQSFDHNFTGRLQ